VQMLCYVVQGSTWTGRLVERIPVPERAHPADVALDGKKRTQLIRETGITGKPVGRVGRGAGVDGVEIGEDDVVYVAERVLIHGGSKPMTCANSRSLRRPRSSSPATAFSVLPSSRAISSTR